MDKYSSNLACLLLSRAGGRQAVAEGAPSAFAVIVPELLAFVRGPEVRGKKERLVKWLESTLTQENEHVV